MAEPLTRLKPETGRRYLLMVRAGDDSLHQKNGLIRIQSVTSIFWCRILGPRSGTIPRTMLNSIMFMAGATAWPAYHEILRDNPRFCAKAMITSVLPMTISKRIPQPGMRYSSFVIAEDFDLAQPAINGADFLSHHRGRFLNFVIVLTTYVENMCPVFSQTGAGGLLAEFWRQRFRLGNQVISGPDCWRSIAASWQLSIRSALPIQGRCAQDRSINFLNDRGIDPTAEKGQRDGP